MPPERCREEDWYAVGVTVVLNQVRHHGPRRHRQVVLLATPKLEVIKLLKSFELKVLHQQ